MRITLSPYRHLYCHCEERSDVAIQSILIGGIRFAIPPYALCFMKSGIHSSGSLSRLAAPCDGPTLSLSFRRLQIVNICHFFRTETNNPNRKRKSN
jgi:hypothetical protein